MATDYRLAVQLQYSNVMLLSFCCKERDDLDEKLRQQAKMLQEAQQRCRQMLSELTDLNDRCSVQ